MSDRHGDQPPPHEPEIGTRWVRCYKSETGPEARPGWRWEPIDLEVADLVERLQREGEPFTVASCSGHGLGLPHVLLEDGRVLLVVTPQEHRSFDERRTATSSPRTTGAPGPTNRRGSARRRWENTAAT